ncbi:unnamed protein product [Adineta ricciae]|uniref:SH3 domain-containing protein n=1 Tax=Adineta ricciae TaxID=249248 RepID=A0A814LNN3_ADIRI|nr:unnamed protein product [Adineta ricciae]CAF1066193.1 unnamed protein product [Adineta ricciae]
MSWREALKKPVAKPTAPKPKFVSNDDDWETDISYENQTTEKSQRYGSATVPGSGRIDHVDFKSMQEKLKTADQTVKQVYQDKNPNRGYGGKFGTDQVMDKSAADFSYKADVQKHSSQTDGKKGFGGAYGVDERAKDKSALGFDYRAEVEKHPSQTDFSKGFGGKFGTDSNAQDKSAVGFSHRETVPKHSSQKDYSMGFGGKYGVQKEEPSRLNAPSSPPSERKVEEKPAPPTGSSAGVGNIRARFENMKKEQEEEAAKRVAEERNKRAANDQKLASNGHAKVNHSEVSPPPATQPKRDPSPPAPQPVAPPPPTQVYTPTVYENTSNNFEPQRSTAKEEPVTFVGNVNVSTLLRQRKASSSSSKNGENDDDEWTEEPQAHQQPSTWQRDPSPTPVHQPEHSADNGQDQGIRCIAHYSYQKTEDDELGFEENEIITNVQKMHEEWWFGKIGSRSGLFPSNYVEEI